jgi:hypothetical protein
MVPYGSFILKAWPQPTRVLPTEDGVCTLYNEWNPRWLKIMTLRQKDGSGTHTHTRGDGANDSSRENHQESKKHPQDSTRQNLLIWRFPKIGVPPVLIHFSGIFHHEPSIWEYHHFSKPPYIINMFTSGLIVDYIYIWVNYNISLTWIVRPFGDDFPY